MIAYISVGLLGLLALSIPVGIVLFLLGFGIDTFFSSFPLIRGLGNMVWSSSNSATLIAIPFFVLLGEILVRSGVATRTYAALDRWVSWLPGGLVHANIATATMFSATSGSSVATAATVATRAPAIAAPLTYRLNLPIPISSRVLRFFKNCVARGDRLQRPCQAVEAWPFPDKQLIIND